MPQPDVTPTPPRPRVLAPPLPPRQRYVCTNCGLIVELSSTDGAACRECGHTGFHAA